jgi:hypothetical protein
VRAALLSTEINLEFAAEFEIHHVAGQLDNFLLASVVVSLVEPPS